MNHNRRIQVINAHNGKTKIYPGKSVLLVTAPNASGTLTIGRPFGESQGPYHKDEL